MKSVAQHPVEPCYHFILSCISCNFFQPSTGKKGAGGGGAGPRGGGARTPLGPSVRAGARPPTGPGPVGPAGRPAAGRPSPYDRPRGVGDRYGPPPGAPPPPRNGGGSWLIY